VPLVTADLEQESYVVYWLTGCTDVVKVASAHAVSPRLFSVDVLYLYTRGSLWTTG